MKTCFGCVVIFLLIACLFVFPWGNINWAEAISGVGWICLIAGFAIWFFSAAISAGGNPVLMFPALIISTVKPPGLWGMLMMVLGFILVISTA